MDELPYLQQIVSDLVNLGVIAVGNAVYLVGQSNGGGMALSAASRQPNIYTGVAAWCFHRSPTAGREAWALAMLISRLPRSCNCPRSFKRGKASTVAEAVRIIADAADALDSADLENWRAPTTIGVRKSNDDRPHPPTSGIKGRVGPASLIEIEGRPPLCRQRCEMLQSTIPTQTTMPPSNTVRALCINLVRATGLPPRGVRPVNTTTTTNTTVRASQTIEFIPIR